jgi:hypothetical protein
VPSGTTLSATSGGTGPTSVSLTAGSYTPTTLLAHMITRLNAVMPYAAWSGSLSTGTSGTGLVTLDCSSDTILKTAGGADWNASVASVEQLSGDGYIETVAAETDKHRAIGFSASLPTAGTAPYYRSAVLQNAVILAQGSILKKAESTVETDIGVYTTGDVIRVERVGTTVYYKKNGAIVNTSAVASSGAKYVTGVLYDSASTLAKVRLSVAGVSTALTWQDLVNCSVTGDSWALAFTSAAAGTVIGFVGDIASRTTATTGTQNARGLWLPDCPLMVEGDPLVAPKVTDSRATEGPRGKVITYISNTKRVHKLLRYSHVSRARVWESSATTTYASLQQWIDDTQYAAGHAWFASAGSAFHVYWDNNGTDTILGYELNSGSGPSAGWNFAEAISDLSANIRRVDEGYLGQLAVEFPRLVSEG